MQRFPHIRHAAVVALIALGVTACTNDVTSPPPGPRLLSASAAVAAPTTIGRIELPGLGGQFTQATGINRLGQVIGVASTPTGEYHAMLWIDGIAHDLGVPSAGSFAAASDINDQGQVTVSSGGRGFLWNAGSYRDLGTLGGTLGSLLALNNPGQVAGTSTTAAGETHAFFWTASGMTDLGTLGGTFSFAADINDRSQVVGTAATATGSQHVFLWEAGTLTDLGTPSNSSSDFSQAIAINGAGQVIGLAFNAAGQLHSFLWAGGQPTDLGGGSYALAQAINDRGQVVGEADVNGADVAFLWENGAMQTLPGLAGGTNNSAVAINSQGWAAGWTQLGSGALSAVLWVDGQPTALPGVGGSFTIATAINDRGEIVGYGSDASGNLHALLWRTSAPAPDPAQMLAALGDAIGSLTAAGGLSAGSATALLASVHAAQASLARGDNNAAKGELGAFINKVNALIRSNRLSSADGGRLVSAAQSVIDLLGT
jgi:probable HAF family extracellular repeat protein